MTTLEGGPLTGTLPILRRLGGRAGAIAAIGTALLMALPLQTASAFGRVDGVHANAADFDARTTVVAPTAARVSRVNALGAQVEWSRFGTPHSLIKADRSHLASNV